jgi:hypothetical protein
MSSSKGSSPEPSWKPKAESVGQDTDSIAESVSSVNTQTDHDALGKTLTAHASHASGHMSLSQRVTTIQTNATSDPNFEVDWDGDDDAENPKNWSFSYKARALAMLSINTLVV